MQSASANFLTKNALAYKSPVYLIHFDGESTDYVTSAQIGNPDNTLDSCIKKIAGASQKITPEEGRSSIGEITVSILDYDDEITALIAGDTYNLHRKKTTIKAGYAGNDEADMLTIFTGWVTDIQLWSDGLGYDITITDLQRWMQRKIFRDSETTPVVFGGNPMTILLRILTSTGAGTNGDYDTLAAKNALGIDDDLIAVNHIEAERDKWFAGVNLSFDIRERITAKKFLEEEIFKPCNIYPIIKGDGTFDIKVFRPPLPEEWGDVQTFDEDTIIGIPKWNQNLSGMINECEFDYDYDADNEEFDTQTFFLDSTSITNRGPGKKALKIESKGITTAKSGLEFITRRKKRVFNRYANGPPPELSFSTFFNRQLSEAGDVVPITHFLVPNLETGARGITRKYLEIINRSIDWQKGQCKFTMLHTQYDGKKYAVISPAGTVLSGASTTIFTLETDEGAKFEEGWVIDIFFKNMVAVATNLTITDITGDQITVGSSIGATPAAGWKISFSTYDNCTTEQKDFAFIADGSNNLGAADDDPYYIY
ncbi:MAG TPA: hypothetical protein VMW09_04850 [Desulfatiglandales bacterium]|nr:hypothetical protein [Desulfatiglandales bacterium]